MKPKLQITYSTGIEVQEFPTMSDLKAYFKRVMTNYAIGVNKSITKARNESIKDLIGCGTIHDRINQKVKLLEVMRGTLLIIN